MFLSVFSARSYDSIAVCAFYTFAPEIYEHVKPRVTPTKETHVVEIEIVLLLFLDTNFYSFNLYLYNEIGAFSLLLLCRNFH